MTKTILFLCTGNSCRSILAEAYMNHAAKGGWQAYSAGSQPTGYVHPQALTTLANNHIEIEAPASKSWDIFAAANAPAFELIVTVCDNAAGETCPIWLGHPATTHWPFPDPAAFKGDSCETHAYFQTVFEMIKKRIDQFLMESG